MKRFLIGVILAVLGVASVYALIAPNIVGIPSTSSIDPDTSYIMVQDGITQNSITAQDFANSLNLSGGGGISGEEADPIFMAQSGDYYTTNPLGYITGDSLLPYLLIVNSGDYYTSNPLGYITGYEETDPIWMADSGYYVPWVQVDTGLNNTGSDTIIPSEKAVWSLVTGLTTNFLAQRNGLGFINSLISTVSDQTNISGNLVINTGNIYMTLGTKRYMGNIPVLAFEQGEVYENENILLGHNAGYNHSTLDNEFSVIIGGAAGYEASLKSLTCVGYASCALNTGVELTAIGEAALVESIGSANTTVGRYSMSYKIGSYNTAFGLFSLAGSAPTLMMGSYNSAFGSYAGYLLRGDNNVTIGNDVGRALTGNLNVIIGDNAKSVQGNNNILIGSFTGITTPRVISDVFEIRSNLHTLISGNFATKEVQINDRLIINSGWSIIVSGGNLSFQFFTGGNRVEKGSFSQ